MKQRTQVGTVGAGPAGLMLSLSHSLDVAVMANHPPSRSTTQRARYHRAPSNSSAAEMGGDAIPGEYFGNRPRPEGNRSIGG